MYPESSPMALPIPATIPTKKGLKTPPIVNTTATPGAGSRTVAFARIDMTKIPGYPKTANSLALLRMLNIQMLIATTANKLIILRMVVRREDVMPDYSDSEIWIELIFIPEY